MANFLIGLIVVAGIVSSAILVFSIPGFATMLYQKYRRIQMDNEKFYRERLKTEIIQQQLLNEQLYNPSEKKNDN